MAEVLGLESRLEGERSITMWELREWGTWKEWEMAKLEQIESQS